MLPLWPVVGRRPRLWTLRSTERYLRGRRTSACSVLQVEERAPRDGRVQKSRILKRVSGAREIRKQEPAWLFEAWTGISMMRESATGKTFDIIKPLGIYPL